MSHRVQNNLANVKLLAKEDGVNESSRWLVDQGLMSRRVERVGKKGSKRPCWFGEANNRNVKWKRVENTKKWS